MKKVLNLQGMKNTQPIRENNTSVCKATDA